MQHAKKALLSSGKYCEEALQGRDRYIDKDQHILCAPSGPREERIGVGGVRKRVGSHERCLEQRQLQTSGEWGAAFMVSQAQRVGFSGKITCLFFCVIEAWKEKKNRASID